MTVRLAELLLSLVLAVLLRKHVIRLLMRMTGKLLLTVFRPACMTQKLIKADLQVHV
jgi:hypothetical protein